jgi:putative transposase
MAVTGTTEFIAEEPAATVEMIGDVVSEGIDEREVAERLLAQAREQGVSLVGPGGLLSSLTRMVLETALEAEMVEHLGHEHGQSPLGSNVGNGTRVKMVLTEIGPVEIEVPCDREGSFEPAIVKKRQRRLNGIDEIVLSLTARGLTTGEVAAHLEDVYGAKVSKDTITPDHREGRRGDGRVVLAAAGCDLPGHLRRRAGGEGARGAGPQHPVLRGHGRHDCR